jgi:hypothetical protein
MPRARRPGNGRHKPRTPVNLVYSCIQDAGGPTAVAKLLGISLPTLQRWRRDGRVPDAPAVLEWAGALRPDDAAAYQLARQLAGLRPKRRG